MVTQIELGGVVLDVVKKDIQNIHLSVYLPTGRVRLAAPVRMKLDTIRLFAISKLGWIKQQQKKLREQERESPREYLDRESHYLWGETGAAEGGRSRCASDRGAPSFQVAGERSPRHGPGD
ncbi:MAG: YgjP-like metallopeptidase domain-containing protein [Rubrivivax sp.]|nr:YgjP-like metallopeptidase domain-containing protein [Rubrivivax sp.]